MKIFSKIVDIYNYYKCCPLCKVNLHCPDTIKPWTSWQDHIILETCINKVSFDPPITSNIIQLYAKIDIDCHNCFQFKSTIQADIDVVNAVLNKCIINNELFESVREDGVHWRIYNNYIEKTTKFAMYDTPFMIPESNYITLPLIEVDFNDPEKTFERAHKLSIFS